jgi:hypothetical protein
MHFSDCLAHSQISNAPLKNLGGALEILGCAKQSRVFMHGIYAYAP